MGLFDKINKAWSKADFWDKQENTQQAAAFKEEEERKRRERQIIAQQRAQAQANLAAQQAQRQQVVPTVQEPTPQVWAKELTNTDNSQLKKQNEIKTLVDKNMARALEEEKSRTSRFERQVTDRNWNKRAEATATNRALMEYQEKYGFNQQPEVKKALKENRKTVENLDDNSTSKLLAPVLSAGRVGTGIVEGAAGAYDLLTPGKGQNRLTQSATKKAEEIDALAKTMDLEGHYKTGNVPLEIASYFLPGVLAARGSKALKYTGKVTSKIDDLTKNMSNKQLQRFVRGAGEELFDPRNIEMEAALQARYLGQESAKGNDIGFGDVASESGLAVAGAFLPPALRRLMGRGQADKGVDDVATIGAGGAVNQVMDAAGRQTDEAIDAVNLPNPDEVAPGVIKSPTAPRPTPTVPPVSAVVPPAAAVPPPAATPPVVPPAPVQTPLNPPPAQGNIPVGQSYTVPQAPQTINPEIQKAVATAQAQADEAATAPVPVAKIPEAVPVETPNVAAAKEVPTVIAPSKDVATRQMTPDEMRAKGMDEEQIKAVMDRRAGVEPVKPEPEVPVKTDDELRTDRLAELHARADGAETKEERALIQRLIRAEEQGGGTKVKNDRLEKARNDLSEFEARPIETPKPDVAKSTSTPVKTVAEPSAVPAKAPKTVAPEPAAVEAPKKSVPTKAELQQGARDNTTKSGKVSQKWINQQIRAGADGVELASAVEKVNGRKIPPTPEEKLTKAQRDAANKLARETKAKAKAEGKTKQAAPKLTKELADQTVKETGDEGVKNATARAFAAYTTKVNIDEQFQKAAKTVDDVSDANLRSFVEKTLTDVDKADTPEQLFLGDAISQRLDKMRRDGKITYEELLDIVSGIEQSKILRASKSGQTQRIIRELYGRVPAPVRVKRELSKLAEHFKALGKDFTPSKADEKELIKYTDDFDTAVYNLNAAESNMDDQMAKMIDPDSNMTPEQASKTKKEFDTFMDARKQAQETALKASQAYSDKLDNIKPSLSRTEKFKAFALDSPDHAGNYLRMSMLSAPSGRLRDVFSTTFNVIDQTVWRATQALIGTVSNKTFGTNLIDSMGSNASRWKGFKGGVEKLASSFKGESTLDEATGRATVNDRSELKNYDSISTFGKNKPTVERSNLRKVAGLPKKVIRASVQASTDLSYGIYTDHLYSLGLKAGRENGLSGKQAERYAEMFMERPDADSMKDAARIWLENSGMHDNFISRNLTKLTDALDKVGSKTTRNGKPIPIAERTVKKATARIVRTTTIPFVQYMGGATHAMLIKQNPLVNLTKAGIAAFKKDPQKAVEELARGGWNAAKIHTLTGIVAAGHIELSDTDADGKSAYNGPYVVRDGQYIPASSFGIAAGAAIISAYYVNKAKEDLADGDIMGVAANSTIGPFWGALKASGMDNMLSGSNVLAGLPATMAQTANNASKDSKDLGETFVGGVMGDLGTQAIPAVLRDIDAFLNQNPNYNPTREAPDTSGKGEDGRVNPIRKGIAQIKGGIPFLSDDLPRKSGSNAKTFTDRIFNANTQSEQQAAGIRAKEGEERTSLSRAESIFGDNNISSLLNEETRAIHDKYKGDISKASKDDLDKIWKNVKESRDRLLDDGKYESYSKVLRHEYEEMKAKGDSSNTDLQKFERKITRSDVAGRNKVDPQIYRLYTGDDAAEGGGISQSEFAKMMDPEETDVYDPDTAALLWALDELFTEAGVSANTNGIDPWTRPKYKVPKNGWGGSGSGGSKSKQIETNFGTLGSFAKSGNLSQKYQKLVNRESPLPNLTAQSSQTNLKKKISVVKGVKL